MNFNMLDFIWTFNRLVILFFSLFYFYQIVYIVFALFAKLKKNKNNIKNRRYAVMIAARNESLVIAELIRSIKAQDYPSELIDIYVIADNCTDNTAQIARDEGANVIVRFNDELIGKGYALDYAFTKLKEQGIRGKYDGFFVFDADNVLDSNYISEMNKVFCDKYVAVTSYRNSKNFGDSWLSSSYSLWFLREARYLNKPRMLLNTSCAISGTGFLLRSDIIERNDGWKFFLLTEDIQFNAQAVLNNEQIGYCEDAIFYDEQPKTFKQSWNQRMRWVRGTYQVLARYGTKLFAAMFRKKPFAKFDMLMAMAPAMFITLISVVVNLIFLLLGVFEIFTDTGFIRLTSQSLFNTLLSFYTVFAATSLLTLITEWKRIKAPVIKKILSVFTFPFFVFTYIPISIVALFKKVEWSPIKHTVVKSAEDFRED